MKRTFATLAVTAVLALAVAAAALAGGSTLLSGYGGEAGTGSNVQPKAPTGQVAAVKPGTLPFTGTDLAVAGGAALLLLGSGFGLRRLGRNKS